MYSGKDAANPAYPTQWALNPIAYQNMDTSQVDWAALAQQWIAMKEAASIVTAPPPPSIEDETDEGEAPMEVENTDVNSDSSGPPGAEWNPVTNSWGPPPWNQWGWGWPGPGSVDPKIPPDPSAIPVPPMIDGYPIAEAPPLPGYTSAPMTASTFQHGYWTAPQSEPNENRENSHGRDDRHSKTKNKDIKSTRIRPPREKLPVMPPVIEPIVLPPVMMSSTIDAAKRRQLPAWIREGLEKMEREKQRAIEREQEQKARQEAEKAKKKLEEQELARLKAAASGVPLIPAKSKFETDSEAEEDSAKVEKPVPASSREEVGDEVKEESVNKMMLPKRSKEEIMQEVMLAVRRSITEILLEVTDHEIHTVSQEELARYNFHQATRLNAMKASKSKALSAITSGLGLGAYESSSEESAAEEDPNDVSDHQLQEVIRRRRAEFERTAREIEAEVRLAESRERATPIAPAPAYASATPEHAPSSPATPTTRSSSATPPPLTMNSETPEKKHERRPSKEKRSNHRVTDRVDGVRKMNTIYEDRKEVKKSIRFERTPSPPKTPEQADTQNSNINSSDSEEDSDTSSSNKSSTESVPKIKLENSRPKKRKRKSSSYSDSPKKVKKSKHMKGKPHKTEEKNSKLKRYDDYKSKSKKSDDYYEKARSSRDYDRSREKYKDGSEDERQRKRAKRSVSNEDRYHRTDRDSKKDRRSYDRDGKMDNQSYDRDSKRDRRSYDRDSKRERRSYDREAKGDRPYERNDKYVRVREYERRRSRSGSRTRPRR